MYFHITFALFENNDYQGYENIVSGSIIPWRKRGEHIIWINFFFFKTEFKLKPEKRKIT